MSESNYNDVRSNDVALVANNLDAIMHSSTYKLASEDHGLIATNEMRGLRMLLEISKPDILLEQAKIQSTIIVFGGAHLVERCTAQRNLATLQQQLQEDPNNQKLQDRCKRAKQLLELSRYYDEAREFAKLASAESECAGGCRGVIVTGGGPGIMEAANRGAFDIGQQSIGLNIELPNEQHPNPFVSPELCFKFNYFALRKFHFVMRAEAAVLFPGGFGTLDELFEVLTLCQTGIKSNIPVILVGREYWSRLINFEFLADSGLAGDDCFSWFSYADTAQEALEIIHHHRHANDLHRAGQTGAA